MFSDVITWISYMTLISSIRQIRRMSCVKIRMADFVVAFAQRSLLELNVVMQCEKWQAVTYLIINLRSEIA